MASLTSMTATSTPTEAAAPPDGSPAPATGRWTAQWKELYEEVITTGLCTGCAGCVVTCPHDVIGYEHEEGKYLPFHLEEELGPDNCIHGEKGCTSCTRACPRFRSWETEIDTHLFGRPRNAEEVDGVSKDIILARATDPEIQSKGQDGGLVSAILIWLLDESYIDGALVSYLSAALFGSTYIMLTGIVLVWSVAVFRDRPSALTFGNKFGQW